MGLLKKNITFHSCHLDILADEKPKGFRSLVQEVLDLLTSGELSMGPTSVYPFASAPEWIRNMASGSVTGKVVFEVYESLLAKLR